jgi:hypothetical protein
MFGRANCAILKVWARQGLGIKTDKMPAGQNTDSGK